MKTKHANWFGLMAVTALPLLSAYSQETPAPVAQAAPVPAAVPASFSPAVAEVVKLAQSGLGDDVVVAYIKNAQAPYNLSASDIVALKNAGVSGPVITAMLNQDKSLRSQSRPSSYDQKPYPPAQPSTAIPNAPTVPPAATVPSAPAVTGPSSVTNAQPIPLQPNAKTPTVVEQAPPPPRVDIIPLAPSPDYYWVPGYWSWNGTWVWVSGRWVVRPWHGAVWTGGHWGRHGRGYIWIGGGWR